MLVLIRHVLFSGHPTEPLCHPLTSTGNQPDIRFRRSRFSAEGSPRLI